MGVKDAPYTFSEMWPYVTAALRLSVGKACLNVLLLSFQREAHPRTIRRVRTFGQPRLTARKAAKPKSADLRQPTGEDTDQLLLFGGSGRHCQLRTAFNIN